MFSGGCEGVVQRALSLRALISYNNCIGIHLAHFANDLRVRLAPEPGVEIWASCSDIR